MYVINPLTVSASQTSEDLGCLHDSSERCEIRLSSFVSACTLYYDLHMSKSK